MSDPNPYADDSGKWGPPQQPGNPPTVPDAQGYGYPGAGTPSAGTPTYGYPQQLPDSAAQQGPGYGYPNANQPAIQPPLPGYGFPPQQGPGPGGGAPMLSFGDITVMNDSIVTPSGTMPLKGAVWTATDMSRTEEKIPTVAIVLAIIFALLCLIGLLFLLMKEKRTTGFIQVIGDQRRPAPLDDDRGDGSGDLPDGDGPDQHGAFAEHLTASTRAADRGRGRAPATPLPALRRRAVQAARAPAALSPTGRRPGPPRRP